MRTPLDNTPDTPGDAEIEGMIFDLLDARRADATICPSEVARALAPQDGDWRGSMLRIRAVAQGLALQGRIKVTRRGVEVDATSRGGPIRLGRRPG